MNKENIRNFYINLKEKISGSDFLFLAFLFIVVLILRGPTLFNDYYDADELAAYVQTNDYISGDIPGIVFTESKKFIYHLLFKAAYHLSYDYGWAFVHLFAIFVVYLNSHFLFLSGKSFFKRKTGMLA